MLEIQGRKILSISEIQKNLWKPQFGWHLTHPLFGLLRGPSIVSNFSLFKVLDAVEVGAIGPSPGPLRRHQSLLAFTTKSISVAGTGS